jgi:transcriptional regulator of heat shock response
MLSDRQFPLIHAVIDEYIKNAEPVGSVEIVAKYNLRCSPATVRNEMAKLIELGFLEMMHTSSGRVPTKMAYRLYLDQMMEERELPVLQEVALKQRLWSNRFEFEKLLRESVLALSEMSRSLAFATTEDGFVSYAGAANILDHKEFWDIDVAKQAFSLLDEYHLLERVLDNASTQGEIKTLIEEEIGIEKLNRCAMVFTEYSAGKRSGKIGVIGPSRISYPEIIPSVKYTKRLIEELGGSW